MIQSPILFTWMSRKHNVLDLWVYFAHAVKGTLKGTDHMFMLHSLFEMNEYFIPMNNKYAFFFLPSDVSTLLFTAAEAFSVFVSLSLSISHSLTQLGTDCCLYSGTLNYLVAKAIFDFITITTSFEILQRRKVWGQSDYARGSSLLLIFSLHIDSTGHCEKVSSTDTKTMSHG